MHLDAARRELRDETAEVRMGLDTTVIWCNEAFARSISTELSPDALLSRPLNAVLSCPGAIADLSKRISNLHENPVQVYEERDIECSPDGIGYLRGTAVVLDHALIDASGSICGMRRLVRRCGTTRGSDEELQRLRRYARSLRFGLLKMQIKREGDRAMAPAEEPPVIHHQPRKRAAFAGTVRVHITLIITLIAAVLAGWVARGFWKQQHADSVRFIEDHREDIIKGTDSRARTEPATPHSSTSGSSRSDPE